jgi:hypothetical protein
MSLFKFTCAHGGNMIIIKPQFLKTRLGRQLLATILGPPLPMYEYITELTSLSANGTLLRAINQWQLVIRKGHESTVQTVSVWAVLRSVCPGYRSLTHFNPCRTISILLFIFNAILKLNYWN